LDLFKVNYNGKSKYITTYGLRVVLNFLILFCTSFQRQSLCTQTYWTSRTASKNIGYWQFATISCDRPWKI